MADYHWPGNVRELENFVQRLTAVLPQNQVDAAAIHAARLSHPYPRQGKQHQRSHNTEAGELEKPSERAGLAAINGQETNSSETHINTCGRPTKRKDFRTMV